MYIDHHADRSYHESWGDRAEPVERLTHLILVDGRLVETWSEPVEGTRWQHHAQRFDRELRRPEPSAPPRPPYEQVLDWLADVCGGPAAVATLDDAGLDDDDIDLPDEIADPAARTRLEASAELLDAVAAQLLDRETSYALRQALLLVWAEEPESVLAARSAAHLAGGICWAVGKANGLLRPPGELTQARVQGVLALSSTLSSCGGPVQRALRGLRAPYAQSYPRPEVPDLLALGHPELLISTTRARLVRLRDRALAARSAAAAS